jgi:transcriptional regulator with XRE-family HTH domain
MGSVHSPRYRRVLKRLRQARLDAKLTQPQVAAALRRPQSYVSKCESGERRVDVIELQDLAKLYRRPVTYFLDG